MSYTDAVGWVRGPQGCSATRVVVHFLGRLVVYAGATHAALRWLDGRQILEMPSSLAFAYRHEHALVLASALTVENVIYWAASERDLKLYWDQLGDYNKRLDVWEKSFVTQKEIEGYKAGRETLYQCLAILLDESTEGCSLEELIRKVSEAADKTASDDFQRFFAFRKEAIAEVCEIANVPEDARAETFAGAITVLRKYLDSGSEIPKTPVKKYNTLAQRTEQQQKLLTSIKKRLKLNAE